MQEHPVPQNITSYEFHLIGNMTLKQFFELAAGGLFAFLSYTSNLPDLLKWPLVVLFVLLGVAFAFVPLEERPLDHWFIAFIRAIYNPTKFYWKKTIHVPEVFSFTKNAQQHETNEDLTALPRKRARAEAYLQSISTTQKDAVEELDERAIKMLDLFQTTQINGEVIVKQRHDEVEKPSLEVSMHSLHAISSMPPQTTDATTQDQTMQPLVDEHMRIEAVYTAPVNIPQDQIVSVQPGKSTTIFKNNNFALAGEVGEYQEQTTNPSPVSKAIPAKTNAQLPFPKTPTVPNLVVGMVLDPDGKMIEQCIVEIRDHTGMPVRALRSNKLGQFSISTPLPEGEYELVVEKDGYSFDTMKLSLKGKVVLPLEVRAKTTSGVPVSTPTQTTQVFTSV